jgi:cation:H+ antiporter
MRALTYFDPRFVLLKVSVCCFCCSSPSPALPPNGPTVFSVSIWPAAIFLAYLATLYATYRYRGQPRWTPSRADDLPVGESLEARAKGNHRAKERNRAARSLTRLWLPFCGLSLVVLVAGWAVAQSADILADQTGLGDAFLGATLLALATSLPELSTTTAASRQGRYSLAISNVFGSNGFDVSLLFLAELVHRGSTIMEHAGGAVMFVAAIGAIMTSIYLWGMLERRD